LNDTSRTVLSTKVYTIPATEEGKEDLVLSNWFLRRIEDRDAGGEVIAAKTGFVTESGNCAASYEVSATGVPYICVTANSDSEWHCIDDHTKLYKTYAA
ncbi:MAG: D-alanyl-D-alanine carboxypeptidase, partial [Blautia sp.]|nr:D-alanyl-D-alanine carboxypeptidase [Blautia sp.]